MDFEYIFTGAVNELSVSNAVSNISLFLLKGATKLIFFISSSGGDSESGIRMYDFLKSLPIPVETIAFGQVASAAVTIYLSGSRRTCTRRANFFIHEGSFSNTYQNTSIKMLDEVVRQLSNSNKKSIEIISAETGKSVAVIKKAVEEGTFMTASEAKTFGLVHDTIDKLNLKHGQPQPPQTPPVNPSQVVVQPTPTAVPNPSQPGESTSE